MIDVADFLDSVTNYGENASDAPERKDIRLAVVDPAYNGNGKPRVTFEGETLLSTKTYVPVDYLPVPGDRVVMLPIGNTYIIMGALASSPGVPVFTSTTRPTAPFVGQQIFETDTRYTRLWDGTQWTFIAAPVGFAEFKTPSPTSIPAQQNQVLSWGTRNVIGDIGSSNSDILLTRPGHYVVRASLRYVSGQADSERFIAISVLDQNSVEVDTIPQNNYTGGAASLTVGGTVYAPVANWRVRLACYSNVAVGIENGWYGHRLSALFVRPPV